MADLVFPLSPARWGEWIASAAAPGSGAGGEFAFVLLGKGQPKPAISVGDRVYVIAFGLVRAYVPLLRLENGAEGWRLVCAGGAVHTTITTPLVALPFGKLKERWWDRKEETRFPNWPLEGIPAAVRVSPPPRSVATSFEEVDGSADDEPEGPPPEPPPGPPPTGSLRAELPSDPEAQKKARTLTSEEKKALREGRVSTPGGLYFVRAAAWGGWSAATCSLCATAKFTGKPATNHPHRREFPCVKCGALKVWTRGPQASRAPEVFCVGCGFVFTPTAAEERMGAR